jgi:preprotein translocase subunit SecE
MENKKKFFQRAFPEFDKIEAEKRKSFTIFLILFVFYFIFSLFIFNFKKDTWMIIIPWLPIPFGLLYSIIFSFKTGRIFSMRRYYGFYIVNNEINFKTRPISFVFQITFEILLALFSILGIIVLVKKYFF